VALARRLLFLAALVGGCSSHSSRLVASTFTPGDVSSSTLVTATDRATFVQEATSVCNEAVAALKALGPQPTRASVSFLAGFARIMTKEATALEVIGAPANDTAAAALVAAVRPAANDITAEANGGNYPNVTQATAARLAASRWNETDFPALNHAADALGLGVCAFRTT
jgi:hypothetical protein